MAVTKIRKISSWTLLISSIISIIVLGMFYAGGVVDPAAEMKEPIYTGLLINWTSVLFFVTIISTMLFAVWQLCLWLYWFASLPFCSSLTRWVTQLL